MSPMSRDSHCVHLHQGDWAEGRGPPRMGWTLGQRVRVPGARKHVAAFEGWPGAGGWGFLVTSYLDAMIPSVWPEAGVLQGNGLRG